MSIQLGLGRIHALLSHLPVYHRPTIHLAGTNGKGSVSAIVSSILQASALSVGRFNSPHLVSVHDCILINGQAIAESLYADVCKEIEHLNQVHAIQASPFEVLTTIALVIFERAGVDIVVLEAGMGGKLDATNVVADDCIRVSALSAVDLDHQAFLGNTITAITQEKAAIARKGKPFVLGAQTHEEVDGVVEATVGTAGGVLLRAVQVEDRAWDDTIDGSPSSPLVLPGFTLPNPRPVAAHILPFSKPILMTLPLHGDHQLLNLGLALSIISALITQCPFEDWINKISAASVVEGVKGVSWPGRLTYHRLILQDGEKEFPILILADGAHNAASARTLSQYLEQLPSHSAHPVHIHYTLALSHSPPKTPSDTLTPLFSAPVRGASHVACVRFSPPASMPWIKTVPPSEIESVVRTLTSPSNGAVSLWAASDEESGGVGQLKQALSWLSKNMEREGSNIVVIAGSLYLIADLYRLLDQVNGKLFI